MQTVKKPRYFYGWTIVVIALLTMLVIYGARHSFSVFYVAILEDFKWARGETAGIFSINMIFYGVSSALGGYLVDRFGARKVFPIGGLLLGLTLVALSQAKAMWHFYIVYGVVMGLVTSAMGYVAFTTALAPWFSQRRGTALGIAFAGANVANFMSIFVQYLISTMGWRGGFQVLGLLVFAVVTPLTAIFFRSKPENIGLLPDGASERVSGKTGTDVAQAKRIVDRKWASTEWTLSKSVKTRRFWALMMVLFFGGITISFANVHLVAYCVDVGFSKMFAATVFGFVGAFGVLGFLGGVFSDRWGREWILTGGHTGIILALLLLLTVRDASRPWLLWLFAVVFGFSRAVDMPMNAAMASDLFQGKQLGIILGIINWGFGFGSALGGWLAGYIFDLTRSYDFAFVIACATSALAIIIVWTLVAPSKVRLVPGQVRRLEREAAKT